jgi:trimethylamine:corrinoid methyltransferase-like protein
MAAPMQPYPLRILRPDEPPRIHAAALRVLEETGMLVDHAGARDLLDGAGAAVDATTPWGARTRSGSPAEVVRG